MDSGIYAAYSGLLARTQTLDSAASNLANSSTSGFRAEREYFREAIAGTEAFRSQLGKATSSFSVLGGSVVDQSQGQVSATGNPLDLAIQGSGFFAFKSLDGVRYTRDGAFRESTNGTLQTATGEPLLNDAGKILIVPPGSVTVGTQGDVSVDGAIVGRLGMYTLPSESVTAEGVNRYKLADGIPPLQSTQGAVRQGFLEASNEDTIQGSLQLVVLQRQAEMMQKALNVFQGNLDKVASEDLPRIQG